MKPMARQGRFEEHNEYLREITSDRDVGIAVDGLKPIDASAQSNADCSAAVQRVLAQTQGELLSVSVGKSGGQAVCKITVLANDSSGKRRRKLTVNARP